MVEKTKRAMLMNWQVPGWIVALILTLFATIWGISQAWNKERDEQMRLLVTDYIAIQTDRENSLNERVHKIELEIARRPNPEAYIIKLDKKMDLLTKAIEEIANLRPNE